MTEFLALTERVAKDNFDPWSQRQRAVASRFAERLTARERLPCTVAIWRQDREPPAHRMFSVGDNHDLEHRVEQWFKRYNRQTPENVGARKSKVGGAGEWRDHRSLAARRHETHRAERLERAAEPSRQLNVNLGPQVLNELPGGAGLVCSAEGVARQEGESGVGAGAERHRRADRAEGRTFQPHRAGYPRNGGGRGPCSGVLGARAGVGSGAGMMAWVHATLM